MNKFSSMTEQGSIRRALAGTVGLIAVSVVVAAGSQRSAKMAWAAEASQELAKVNGTSISERDLRAALSSLNEGQRDGLLKDPGAKRQLLQSMIDRELMYGEAVKQKLDQDEEFKEALASFRREYLANRLATKVLAPKVTNESVKKYYEANKQRYSNDQVHAQHILVADEARARELLAEAKKPGADFQALAEKNSKDPSAQRNRGDLGFFGRDLMVKEFTDAAFDASEGEVVGPVRTAYGYHVIKVLEKKLGRPQELSEVEVRVRHDMGEEIQQAYVSNLRKGAKIHVNTGALGK